MNEPSAANGKVRKPYHKRRSRRINKQLHYKRMGRELAMQYLFECDLMGEEQNEAILELFWEQTAESGEFPDNRIFRKAREFAEKLIAGVESVEAELDSVIEGLSKQWDIERMSAVDRNIMRIAIYELKFCPDIPALVSINEAIEIAKDFSSEKSGQFINGILNAVKDTLPADAGNPLDTANN